MDYFSVLYVLVIAVIGFLLIASYIENDDSSITGFLTFVLIFALFPFFGVVVIPNEVEKAKKETSWKCQFEECPYTYAVEKDTVLVVK